MVCAVCLTMFLGTTSFCSNKNDLVILPPFHWVKWVNDWNLAKILFALIMILMIKKCNQFCTCHDSLLVACAQCWHDVINIFQSKTTCIFSKFWLWAHKPFVKWFPEHLLLQAWVAHFPGYPHPGLTLQWRHNGHDSVSNHQPHDCLLNNLFRRRSKKTSKLRVAGLCAGNSPGNSPHKWPVTRKMFPFDEVIMSSICGDRFDCC